MKRPAPARGAPPAPPPRRFDRRTEFWVAVTAVVAVGAYLPLAAGALPWFYAPSPVRWSLAELNCVPAGAQLPITERLVPWGARAEVQWTAEGGTKVTYKVFQAASPFVPNPPAYSQLGFAGSWSFVSDGLVYAFQAIPVAPTNHLCETDEVTTTLTYSTAL